MDPDRTISAIPDGTEFPPERRLKVAFVSLYVVGNNGVRFLASVLRGDGFAVTEVYLKDFEYHKYTPPTEKELSLLINVLRDREIGLVGMSLRAGAYLPLCIEVTRRIREELEIPVMWGGQHVTMAPDDCIEHADFLVLGEAEQEITGIVETVQNGGDVSTLPNVWVRKGDGLVRNQLGSLCQLDDLPLRDYHSLEDKFWVHRNRVIRGEPVLNERIYLMLTSRGCLYKCGYCNVSILRNLYKHQGRYFRYHSVEAVISELEEAKRTFTKLKRIRFDDQIFVPDREWVREFCELYPKRVGLPFEILLDPRIIDEDAIGMLAEAGMDQVLLGIQSVESANRRLYDRPVTDEKILETAHALRRHKVLGAFQVIVDDPETTLDEKERLLELLLSLPRPYDLYIFSLCHWPGTTRTKALLEKGLITPDQVEGRTGKAFRQFLADFSWPRSAEDNAFLALYELANKRTMPRWVVRRLSRSKLLRSHPLPLIGAAKVLSTAKFFSMGFAMLLRGEVSMATIRRWLHVLFSPSI